MTKQEWESLTEEEKEKADKALEQFLKKESKRLDNEKWISIEGLYGQNIALRVSNIEYIEATNQTSVRIHTNIINDGKKLILDCTERPHQIVQKINGEK